MPPPYTVPVITCTFKPFDSKIHPSRNPKCNYQPPARDRVIDFGKHRGKMLGSLPSTYLKWISKNLRAGNTEEWARLADQVLADPIYNDRLEWELADNVLSGNSISNKSSGVGDRGAVSRLMEISERFGWDNEDKPGWARMKLDLLGTSAGGRIPRLKSGSPNSEIGGSQSVTKPAKITGSEEDRKRRERRERRKAKEDLESRERKVEFLIKNNGDSNDAPPRFPGREELINEALKRGRRSSL